MSWIFNLVLVAAVCYLLYQHLRRGEADKTTEGKKLQEVTDWLLKAGVDLFHPLFYAIIGGDKGDVESELKGLHRKLADPDDRETALRKLRRNQARKLLQDTEDRVWLYELVEEQRELDTRSLKKNVETAEAAGIVARDSKGRYTAK